MCAKLRYHLHFKQLFRNLLPDYCFAGFICPFLRARIIKTVKKKKKNTHTHKNIPILKIQLMLLFVTLYVFFHFFWNHVKFHHLLSLVFKPKMMLHMVGFNLAIKKRKITKYRIYNNKKKYEL